MTAALRSPDPAAYVTCLPVHMDGSCNGLQHYAALGRDKPGALKVSLSPSDRPGDVYSAVVSVWGCVQRSGEYSGMYALCIGECL